MDQLNNQQKCEHKYSITVFKFDRQALPKR